jgi:NAD(P)-dependent dehydrogenase (short-subunit alcohol dehydrogenase family)
MVASFKRKVMLVTGGGSAIGQASAVAFARKGGKVVSADISMAGGEKTAQMLKERGGGGCFISSSWRLRDRGRSYSAASSPAHKNRLRAC